MNATSSHSYRTTESKYKGGAHEMYVTYDLEQKTRGGNKAIYPKVKRLYIAGDVKRWDVGDFQKRSGRKVYGVRIEYEQTRRGYDRAGFAARRGASGTDYKVKPSSVRGAVQLYSQVVELPSGARNVQFHEKSLPGRYQSSLQSVR